MRRLIMMILAIFALPAFGESCLQLKDERFEQSASQFGGANIQWQAKIENRCDRPFDALMTLHFVTPEGDSLSWVRVVETLEIHESKALNEELMLPSRVAEQFAGIRVELEERERPL